MRARVYGRSMRIVAPKLSERLGRRVDLATEGSLHPRLRNRILGEARVLYEHAA